MRRIGVALVALGVATATTLGVGSPAFANNQHPGNATMRVAGGGTYLIAEEFSDAGWAGSILSAVAPNRCFDSPQNAYKVNVPNSPAWNDIISSAQMFAGCRETLYDNTGCTGTFLIIPADETTSFGASAMNDKTTCIAFYIP